MRALVPFLFCLLATRLWSQPLLDARALIDQPRWSSPCWSPTGEWLAVSRAQANWKQNRLDSVLELYWRGQGAARHRFPSASQARWSPDGSQLLFLEKGQLKVCRPGKAPWVSRSVKECEAALWSPDGRHIACVIPVGPARRPDSGRLYDDLFLRRWNHYYDGRRRHLFWLDTRSDRCHQLTSGAWDAAPTSGALSSRDNMAFSKDGQYLYFVAPPPRGQARSTNTDVYRLELSSGRQSNLTEDNPAADLAPQVDAAGRLWIASHSRPGYESDALRLRSRGPDETSWKVEAEGVHGEWYPTSRGLLVSHQERGRSYFSLNGRRWGPESLQSLSVQGQQWAGIVDALHQPPQVIWGFLNSPEARPLHPSGARGWKLGEVESLEVPVEGARMQMWLIKPPDYRPDRRYPLVMLLHGGPQGGWGNHWSLRWNPQVWAAQGYLVAMPNPRGSSGQGAEFQDQVSRDWGGKVVRDIQAGIQLLATRPDVDPQRMAAAGASFGGYMVNWLAVHSHPFRCLVTHCGVWNLESMYGSTDELWFADWEFGGPPWGASRPRDYDEFSPHRLADRLKTPHLVIHNDLDYRCPIDQGLQLFTALQTQGVPSRFLNFPDEGHWVLKPHNSLRWHREVFDFVAGYLK